MRLTGRASITRRLTLLFVAASSAVLLVLGFVIASSVEKHFDQQDMEVLVGKMELVRYTLEKLPSPGELAPLKQQLDYALVGHQGLDLIVLATNRHLIFASPNASLPIDLAVTNARRHPHRPFTWKVGERHYRGIAAELSFGIKKRQRGRCSVCRYGDA